MGILEETYLLAVPLPGLFGGNRRAIIDVDLGITVVSSAYSIQVSEKSHIKQQTNAFIPSLVSSL